MSFKTAICTAYNARPAVMSRRLSTFPRMHSRKCGEVIPRVRLRALREDARYFCIETGKTYAGRTLMHLGLSAELNGDFDSGVFYFQAVKEG